MESSRLLQEWRRPSRQLVSRNASGGRTALYERHRSLSANLETGHKSMKCACLVVAALATTWLASPAPLVRLPRVMRPVSFASQPDFGHCQVITTSISVEKFAACPVWRASAFWVAVTPVRIGRRCRDRSHGAPVSRVAPSPFSRQLTRHSPWHLPAPLIHYK